jgi:hypothetical protein
MMNQILYQMGKDGETSPYGLLRYNFHESALLGPQGLIILILHKGMT